jgi:hypothetical protein
MARLWMLGRSSLLMLVGLGFLGYKTLQRGRKVQRLQQVGVGVGAEAQKRTRTTLSSRTEAGEDFIPGRRGRQGTGATGVAGSPGR